MKKNMGFFWLLLGGFFLWNPVVGVEDILPDVIGYLLICIGISALADLNDNVAEAQKAFRAMLWVGFGQVAAWLLIEGFLQKTEMEVNQYEEPVWVLVFAFAFLVLEWYFLLPGWKLLFKGLSELAEHHGGTLILRERRGRSMCQRMTALSRAWVICKTLLTVLPETSVLTSFRSESEAGEFFFDWFPYLSLFRVLAAMISIVIGLIWLVGYLRLMRRAMRDEPWKNHLQTRYQEEILSDVGLLLNRRVHGAFSFLRVGALFCVNLTILYREMLPDWVAAILLACGVLLLGDLLKQTKVFYGVSGALLAVGLCRTLLNERFLREDHLPAEALSMHDAYMQYLPVRILSWVEAALTFLVILILIKLLTDLMRRHTALDYGDAELSRRATARLHRALNQKAIPVVVGWGAASVCKALEVELQPIHGWFWMLQLALSLTAALLTFSYLASLTEWIEDRYPAKKRV